MCIDLNFKKLTLKTGFVVQGHILHVYIYIYIYSIYTQFFVLINLSVNNCNTNIRLCFLIIQYVLNLMKNFTIGIFNVFVLKHIALEKNFLDHSC